MRTGRWISIATHVALGSGALACAAEPASDPPPTSAPDLPVGPSEGAADSPTTVGPPVAATTPGASRLLAEAERILAATKQSSYSHTTGVDETTGTFVFDCSGFLNYALARAVPEGFTSLAAATKTRPVAASYVSFVTALSTPTRVWRSVPRAADLVAGDIVAWLRPTDVSSTNTGHVMVVGAGVLANGGEVVVPIIDSSESGHGPEDIRTSARTTGLGRGSTVLIVDGRGAPTGYRWSAGPSSTPHLTKVALAHLE